MQLQITTPKRHTHALTERGTELKKKKRKRVLRSTDSVNQALSSASPKGCSIGHRHNNIWNRRGASAYSLIGACEHSKASLSIVTLRRNHEREIDIVTLVTHRENRGEVLGALLSGLVFLDLFNLLNHRSAWPGKKILATYFSRVSTLEGPAVVFLYSFLPVYGEFGNW